MLDTGLVTSQNKLNLHSILRRFGDFLHTDYLFIYYFQAEKQIYRNKSFQALATRPFHKRNYLQH